MATGAAKESKLAALHEVVAEVLITQIGEKAEEELADGSMVELFTATPALLTCAMKFLKDNEITCAVEASSKVNELAQKLEDRRRGHGNVISLAPKPDEHNHTASG